MLGFKILSRKRERKDRRRVPPRGGDRPKDKLPTVVAELFLVG